MILRTCIFSLNHESSICLKEDYTITHIYQVDKVSAYKNMVCTVKDNSSLGIFLTNHLRISCEVCGLFCTRHVLVG
jgi:hypothetical protein